MPLEPPTPVRAAIAAALEQFDARVAPRLREQGAELSGATRALAAALRHGTPRAIEEALFALRRTMATLGEEFADERTELGALVLGVEYAVSLLFAQHGVDSRAPSS